MELQGKTQRELNNKLSDLNVKMANLKSSLGQLHRHKEEHEVLIRRLRKYIQKKEMELDELLQKSKKFDKDEFEFLNEERFLKKQIEEVRAMMRRITG
jgi:peptidoglycan hydrolase CwlO-like protein